MAEMVQFDRARLRVIVIQSSLVLVASVALNPFVLKMFGFINGWPDWNAGTLRNSLLVTLGIHFALVMIFFPAYRNGGKIIALIGMSGIVLSVLGSALMAFTG
ncbi:MAG TPA: hypothetical protein VGC51_15080 [Hansschlegelia sp.]